MSKIVMHNGVIYLSGQVANDVSGDIRAQTTDVLAKVDDLLAEAGSHKGRILSATIFIRDIDEDFAAMNDVWNAWLADSPKPARACVQAKMARDAIAVEICIIAARKSGYVAERSGDDLP